MARLEVVELIDDLDGTPAAATVHFAVAGTEFEVDLSEANTARLNTVLGRWAARARRVGPDIPIPRPAPVRKPARRDPLQTQAIRAWAVDHGHPVSPKGRISAEVEAAFHAARGGT